MAVYAIGDLQGCYDSLQRLLDHIRYDDSNDRLWFTGDLVNRGPDSLKCLRFVKDLGERAVTVLGNHDLHLLAVARGHSHQRRKDTLDDILEAPDHEALMSWLASQPLLHRDADLGYAMVHAGLPPQWDLDQARACAREAEAVLQGPKRDDFLAVMYGDQPDHWSPQLTGMERLRFIINCFTRMRFCDADGRLDLKYKGPPGSQRDGLMPWYEVPGRRSANEAIIFGHWSTHGRGQRHGAFALDTGCLWGGTLTAMRLDGEPEYFSVDCPSAQAPEGY